jgi:murein DD-endopeptidase MepM/ murein hydrolase activator NlpD
LEIILISSKENKRINLQVRFVFMLMAALALILLIILFVYNISIFASHRVDQQRLIQLNSENKIVRQEIDRFKTKFAELTVIIDSLESYDKRLRSYASLEPINDDIRKMGVGGTTQYDDKELSHEMKDTLVSLSQTMDNLLARSRLQRKSFKEIISHLDKKRYLRDHTPSVIPVQGWFISGFGYRIDPFTGSVKMHEGLDIAAPPGTPIIAPADGMVLFVGERGGFGLTLEIDHGHGYSTLYAHCQRIKVEEGDVVRRGEIVAFVGNTGKSTGPHLHYEVRVAGVPRNPFDYVIVASDPTE